MDAWSLRISACCCLADDQDVRRQSVNARWRRIYAVISSRHCCCADVTVMDLGTLLVSLFAPRRQSVIAERVREERIHSSRRIPSSSMCSDFWPFNMFRCDIAKPLNRYSTVQISSLGNQLNIKTREPSSSFRTMPARRLLPDGIRAFGIGIAKEPSAVQYRLCSTFFRVLCIVCIFERTCAGSKFCK